MKHFFIYIVILISTLSCKKTEKNIDKFHTQEDFLNNKLEEIDNVWKKSEFDSAIAVILIGDRTLMYDLTKIDTNYAISSRRKLNQLQLKNITNELSGRIQVDFNPSDCFKPFHGILFYKNDKIIGRLAICFVCSNYITLPKQKSGIDLSKAKQTFIDLGLPVYDWDDSLETAKAKIKFKDFY